jgi:polyphenol oxidase
MVIKKHGSLVTYHFKNLSKAEGLVHFVSTRKGGVSKPPFDKLNIGFQIGEEDKNVLANRKILFDAMGITLKSAVFAKQIHSPNVKIVSQKMSGFGAFTYKTSIKDTDAMVTNEPDICLVVRTADCVPIVVYDRKNKVIGIIHSGWKGTVSKITSKTVGIMINKFKSKPKDIVIGIGPSIGPESYEVGMDVINQIRRAFPGLDLVKMVSKEKGLLNLWEANLQQLLALEIPRKNIEVAGICTYQNFDNFYSYRKSHPTGLFCTGVMMKK